jgi:hypothetical protein
MQDSVSSLVCHRTTSLVADMWPVQLNLGWKLAAAVHGRAAPMLLDSYSEERQPVIESMLQRTTTEFTKTREMAIKEKGKHMARFDQDLNQLGIHYSWSPIIIDDLEKAAATGNGTASTEVDAYTAGSEVHAGNRAPNASGLISVNGSSDSETSLFDLISPQTHLALVFVNAEADLQDIASILSALHSIGPALVRSTLVYAQKPHTVPEGVDGAVIDRDGHAFAAYKPQRYGLITAAIIRPDGMIGAMVRDFKSVGAYFGKLYV